jgi:hypothetical protein
MYNPNHLWGTLDQVKVIDNFFPLDLYTSLVSYVDSTYQTTPEEDRPKTSWVPGHTSTGPLGLVSWFWYMDVKSEELFTKKALEFIDTYTGKKHTIERVYFNGMCHGQESQFHFDDIEDNAYTLLAYVLPTYNFLWGGQIVFIDKDEKDLSICPKPNRIIYFPSKIMHRAQSFTDNTAPMRVSLAFKLKVN